VQSILREKHVERIRDYSSVRVFESNVYPIVYVVKNVMARPDNTIRLSKMSEGPDSDVPVEVFNTDVPLAVLDKLPPGYWWPLFSPAIAILRKVLLIAQNLGTIATVVGAATVSEAYQIAELIEEGSDRPTKPDLDARRFRLINTGTIDRYESLWGLTPTTYIRRTCQRPTILGEKLIAVSHARFKQSTASKIILAGMSTKLEAFYDFKGEYLAGKSTIVVLNSHLNGHFLTAVINSSLCSLVYRELFGSLALQGGYLWVGPPQISLLPIRRIAFTTPPNERARLVEAGITEATEWIERTEEGSAFPGTFSAFSGSDLGLWLDERLSPIHTPAPELVRQHNADPLNEDWQLPEEGPVEQSDVVHDLLAHLAKQMIEMNKQKQAEIKGSLSWLEREIGASIDDLTNKTKLRNYLGDYQKGEPHLTLEEMLGILRKNRRRMRANPSSRVFHERLKQEYHASLEKLLPLKRRLTATDRLIDLIVYRLYGLAEEEVAIVEGAAP